MSPGKARDTVRVENLAGKRTVFFRLEESEVRGPRGGTWWLLCEVVPSQPGAGPGPKRVRDGEWEELKSYALELTKAEILELIKSI